METEDIKKLVEKAKGRGANLFQELAQATHDQKKAHLLEKAEGDIGKLLRLTSVMSGKANAWTAGSGYAKRMPKPVFRAALHSTLGVPIQAKESRCKCGEIADTMGQHFTCCKLMDSRKKCHDRWRDTTAAMVRMAGKEVRIEVGPEDQRVVPGDIFIPSFKDGKALAVDFSISAMMDPGAVDRIANIKEKKYSALCKEKGWDFKPVVADGYGAVRAEGSAFLNALSKTLSEKMGNEGWPSPGMQFWQAVSTCLVRRRADAIAEAWAQGLAPLEVGARDSSEARDAATGHDPGDPGHDPGDDMDDDPRDSTGDDPGDELSDNSSNDLEHEAQAEETTPQRPGNNNMQPAMEGVGPEASDHME
jgi:hypothetical protein